MDNLDIDWIVRNVKKRRTHKVSRPKDQIDAIWRGATDCPARIRPYFKRLGISTVPDAVFRYHPNPIRRRLDVCVGAIIAPVRDALTDDLLGLHLVYLNQSGQFRSSMFRPQTVLRREGGAIKLAKTGRTLAVCASLESALAFMEHRHIPTWCTLTADGAEDFVPPKGVTEIIRVEGPDQGRLNVNGSARHCTTYPCLSIADLPTAAFRKRRIRRPNATVSQSIAMGVPS